MGGAAAGPLVPPERVRTTSCPFTDVETADEAIPEMPSAYPPVPQAVLCICYVPRAVIGPYWQDKERGYSGNEEGYENTVSCRQGGFPAPGCGSPWHADYRVTGNGICTKSPDDHVPLD